MGNLRIMSHNVWKYDRNNAEWEAIGADCSAKVRAKGMVRVYSETNPDIIGFQEMSFVMADEIIRGLDSHGLRYALLWGRDTPILYRQDRFELLDSDFFMYPTEFPVGKANSITRVQNPGVSPYFVTRRTEKN